MRPSVVVYPQARLQTTDNKINYHHPHRVIPLKIHPKK